MRKTKHHDRLCFKKWPAPREDSWVKSLKNLPRVSKRRRYVCAFTTYPYSYLCSYSYVHVHMFSFICSYVYIHIYSYSFTLNVDGQGQGKACRNGCQGQGTGCRAPGESSNRFIQWRPCKCQCGLGKNKGRGLECPRPSKDAVEQHEFRSLEFESFNFRHHLKSAWVAHSY